MVLVQGTRDLNPQPSALEADALPIELVPSAAKLGMAEPWALKRHAASVRNRQRETNSLRHPGW